MDTLCDLYETLTITQAIIYCNTRRKAGETAMGLAGGMENYGKLRKLYQKPMRISSRPCTHTHTQIEHRMRQIKG